MTGKLIIAMKPKPWLWQDTDSCLKGIFAAPREPPMTANKRFLPVALSAPLGTSLLVCMFSSAIAADYTIHNPADKIRNPAERMYNPAADIKNPAAVITNPAAQMTTNPNPLPSVVPPVVVPAEQGQQEVKKRVVPVVPKKYYTFKKVREYLDAAKKAFVKDDYQEFTAITEDALRRIDAGSLKASAKTRKKLDKYKVFGYSLLEEAQE
jgi:hypothetical protein